LEKNVQLKFEEEKIGESDVVINCAGETRWGMLKEDYQNRVI